MEKRINVFIFIFIVLTLLIYSCSGKTKQNDYKPNFSSFEISLKSGMGKGFSLLVDSNKIYFAPQIWDTCFYGFLQDTVLMKIDSFCLKIKNITYKTVEKPCDDCSNVAFKTVIDKDTFRVHQFGEIDQ